VEVKFSEDVVPVTTLKAHSARLLRQVAEGRRPILLTSRGRGVAVVQSLQTYEKQAEELRFMRAVVEGLRDVEEGRVRTLAEAKARFGSR